MIKISFHKTKEIRLQSKTKTIKSLKDAHILLRAKKAHSVTVKKFEFFGMPQLELTNKAYKFYN